MKNSKKLLVLVLSLVMLIAAFAMCVSAEGDKATVQYPDGTTVQYAVGETIVPPFGNTYAGAGNTLYKNTGAGWKFTMDGAEVTSLTVTEDMIGKTIVASGFEKVYFTVAETGGSTTYYTNASTAGTDFRSYMQAMLSPAGATVTLYDDIACASLAVQGANTNLNYFLDLNGHKLTITTSGGIAMDVRQYAFYLYSSKPGGVLDASAGACAFRTNDGTINGVKQWGKLYVGEDSETGTKYHDNLTVYCKQINTDMYGTSAYFLGGKYVQVESSSATFMLVIGRVGNVSNSQVQRIRNCTFVTCKAATAPIEQSAKDARIYDGCTFINAAGGLGKIFANATMNGNPEFKNCKFYNVDPAVSYGGQTLKYSGTLADPRILILDEATASVDTMTEAKIQAAMESVTAGRTSLMIAHRLSTVRSADLILVVKNGRIVEQGPHPDLLAKKGYYYELYTRQYEDEVTAKILA